MVALHDIFFFMCEFLLLFEVAFVLFYYFDEDYDSSAFAARSLTPRQVVILRHSLFALAGRDVMVAGFMTVSSVTVSVLAAIVGVVSTLMLAGVAQASTHGTMVVCTR